MISVLIPTLPERAHWLDRTVALYRERTTNVEILTSTDGSSWGEAINLLTKQASGDYLHLSADDSWPASDGWWQPAIEAVNAGHVACPRVVNMDGSLQSCGAWRREMDDWEPFSFSRWPVFSREMWDAVGPCIPTTGYADVYLSQRASEHGWTPVVRRGYELVHAYAPEGRRSKKTCAAEERAYAEAVA